MSHVLFVHLLPVFSPNVWWSKTLRRSCWNCWSSVEHQHWLASSSGAKNVSCLIQPYHPVSYHSKSKVCQPSPYHLLPPKTNRLPLKKDGWKTNYFAFETVVPFQVTCYFADVGGYFLAHDEVGNGRTCLLLKPDLFSLKTRHVVFF